MPMDEHILCKENKIWMHMFECYIFTYSQKNDGPFRFECEEKMNEK